MNKLMFGGWGREEGESIVISVSEDSQALAVSCRLLLTKCPVSLIIQDNSYLVGALTGT